MWLSACCLFVTLLLAIIGVSIDILMVEQGTTFWNTIEVTLDYGWQEMRFTVDTAHYNTTSSIVYSDAYDEYCTNATNTMSFCSDLKSVRDAGRAYIAFNIIGIFLLTISLAMAIFVSLGKCLCDCRCRLGWIIAILCTTSVLCFLISFSVFTADFSQNLNALFEQLTPYKVVNWQTYIGASIGCLIAAVGLGLMTLTCILWIDRDFIKNRREQQYERFDNSAPGYPPGFGPPPMYPPYGQPPPYGMPPPGPPPPGYYQVQYNSNLTPV